MAIKMATTIDTPDYTVILDAPRPGVQTQTFTAKPGSSADNAEQLRQKADQAIATLEDADAKWGSLSAAQKDAATRLAIRVVAKLARLVLGRLDGN